MKKRFLSLALVVIAVMVWGSVNVYAKDSLKTAALGFLNKAQAATADPDENKIGFKIRSVTKSGNDYIVSWECANDIIKNNSDNQFYAMSKIHYIDPEDYANHYQPFTRNGDQVSFNFETGDEISPLVQRIKFEPPSKVMYVYFSGVPDDGNNPPELYTVPLFYTLVLGDKPYVLEATPRRAGNLFDAAIAK